MDQTITEPWIKLKGHLNREEYHCIRSLQLECQQTGNISLKLELDYKLEDAANSTPEAGIRDINEFMAFDGERLIGYIGICGFGEETNPLEITGMVHPAYRRQGIFSALYTLVRAECGRRKASAALGLCDRGSESGQAFMKTINAHYKCSEFEMVLHDETAASNEEQWRGIRLRKATNADAGEIARQNRIYFSDTEVEAEGEETKESALMPEDEEKRGMTIYLAEKDGQGIGKVNLELLNGTGGIYGFGVLPAYRRKGFGRAILLQSIARLKAANASEINLQVSATNANALNLYKSCGFQETSTMDYFMLID